LPLLGGRIRPQARPEDAGFAPVFKSVPYIPKIGSRWNHRLMARSLAATVANLRREFAFDVVLCSWLYPDGCALAELAQRFGFRLVLIAQGTDVHQYLENPVRRRAILEAARQSRAVITRSRDLAKRLNVAGVSTGKLFPVYNGIDRECFCTGDRDAARKSAGLPLDAKVILYVGNFLPIKNPMLLVRAVSQLPARLDANPLCLAMVGDGPLLPQIKAAAAGLTDRLFLPGRLPPAEVATYMRAADLLCVSSDNEGVPNVVLEAFACGLPVVATDVGGISEVLRHPTLGELVERGNVQALAAALARRLKSGSFREEIARRALQFDWGNTARAYLDIFNDAVRQTPETRP
jgi:glycosyltransferase involved in cell wall biosynthesis